jgi:hypothetical protein
MREMTKRSLEMSVHDYTAKHGWRLCARMGSKLSFSVLQARHPGEGQRARETIMPLATIALIQPPV